MIDILIGYALVTGFWLLGSIVFGYCTESMPQKVMLARGVFLAPIWPVVLIVALCRWVHDMWRAADWKNL